MATSSPTPMDVDPIDDGPSLTSSAAAAAPPASEDTAMAMISDNNNNNNVPTVANRGNRRSMTPHTPSLPLAVDHATVPPLTQEEAADCIERLRGGPMGNGSGGSGLWTSSSNGAQDGGGAATDPTTASTTTMAVGGPDDISQRVAAAHRLDAVAVALGPARTREELLPFIADGIDDDDEVLLAMAISLGRMLEGVGGPAHSTSLIRPLELLLTMEETSVREAASIATTNLWDQLTNDDQQADLTEWASMVARLAGTEWFTGRRSAAALIAPLYPRLPPRLQSVHLEAFGRLCRDDTPMVRRQAARALGPMLLTVARDRSTWQGPDSVVAKLLVPLFGEFAAPEQPDSVRLQTTENCVAFGQVLADHQRESPLTDDETSLLAQILPLIVATIDDRSWRVRWTAAAKFADVMRAYEGLPQYALDALVPAYEKLLQDPEAEVRTAATFNLAHVAQCHNNNTNTNNTNTNTPPTHTVANTDRDGPRVSVAERLVQRVTSLTEDDSEHVRAALAMVATELAPTLGIDATITHLVPPVLLLLRDAASQVRLNLISSLSALNEVIGVDLLSQSLLPAILDLAQDGKWRIRLAIIQHIPLLAKQLGKEFFTEKLSSLCVGWLGDDIASIRQAAAANLKDLTALFGTEWANENLIPPIVEIREHQSYLRRLTALKACAMMATAMDAETARRDVLPIILEMAVDVVPNIRFNVAKELAQVAPACRTASAGSVYESQVLPVLSMLMEDDDRDVRFFAEQTVHTLDETFRVAMA